MQPELYTAAQGLVARQFQLDNITNNIANANTTGFREVRGFFRSFNEALAEGPNNVLNNAANNQPVIAGVFFHSRQGAIRATGNPFDMAIEGNGFFRVETPNGQRYTRNGSFTISNQSQLVTRDGYPVVDANTNLPITLNTAAEDTYIKGDGTIIQDGVVQGRVKLVDFADKELMRPEADTLLVHENPNAVEIAADGEIHARHLETSNVNIAKQMVDMITMQRAYDANIRVIRTIDGNLNEQVIRGYGPR
ncbi:MAG: flagellar basal-body rod protein FlgF [Acidobacteriota bacterium]|nr:flagellar basal-body rod protein FlgF [Acidobacteriota bacterium]